MSKDKIKKYLAQIVSTIVRRYKPERVILFGSYAWGTPGPDSDLDFFVIKETNEPSLKRIEAVDKLFPVRHMAMDFLVYTPEQVEQRLAMGDFFVRNILTRGKQLYAR